MAVRTILRLGDPVLRLQCARVLKFQASELETLVGDLRETLADFRSRAGFGRGIAAPQIGNTQRVILIVAPTLCPMMNPRIVRRSATRMTLWDDCFSFPDLMVKVVRHVRVDVAYQDIAGRPRTLRAEGGMAELVQHEIDHLDGILAIDRAVDSRHVVYREEWEKMGRPSAVSM
jgi:peptide deformylase